MARYKEVPITGSQWVQLNKARINFSTDKPTHVTFNEELVRVLDQGMIKAGGREIEVTLTTPSDKFILVDPDTNLPTGGDMSYRQLERALYSLYYAEAVKLDQQG